MNPQLLGFASLVLTTPISFKPISFVKSTSIFSFVKSKLVSLDNVGHNWSKSQLFQVQPVTCCDISVYLYVFEVCYKESSNMIGNSLAILNLNRIFLKQPTHLQIWANQSIHSFVVGCLNPCLQETCVQVVLPQPSLITTLVIPINEGRLIAIVRQQRTSY